RQRAPAAAWLRLVPSLLGCRMAWTALTLVVALLPGLFAWRTGRRLVLLRDDPALPERLIARRTQLTQVAALCWGGPRFLPGGGGWIVPLGVVALLAGSFPARRALFDETWSLSAYLAWSLRLALASVGFWLLLASAPAIVAWTDGSGWAVGGLTSVLLAWGFWFPPLFGWALRAGPRGRPDLAGG